MDPGGRCSASTSSEGHGACAGQVASSLAGCPLGKGWRLSGQGRGGEGGEGSLCSSVRVTRVRSLAVVNRAFWRDTDPSKIGGPAKEEQGVGALGCWVWPKWGHVGPGHPLPPTLAAAAGLGLQGKPWAGETALLSGGQRCQGGGTEAGGGQTTLLRAPRAVRLLGAWWCRWPGAACGFGEGTAWSLRWSVASCACSLLGQNPKPSKMAWGKEPVWPCAHPAAPRSGPLPSISSEPQPAQPEMGTVGEVVGEGWARAPSSSGNATALCSVNASLLPSCLESYTTWATGRCTPWRPRPCSGAAQGGASSPATRAASPVSTVPTLHSHLRPGGGGTRPLPCLVGVLTVHLRLAGQVFSHRSPKAIKQDPRRKKERAPQHCGWQGP